MVYNRITNMNSAKIKMVLLRVPAKLKVTKTLYKLLLPWTAIRWVMNKTLILIMTPPT